MYEDFVAVFDSGVGGVSVLRELVRIMPEENYLYYGDSANAPYGEKSTEQVRQLADLCVEKLTCMGAKAVVVACNTATGAAIEFLRDKYSHIPVIGIEPALKPAVLRKSNSVVLVMATHVTLNEEKFLKLAAHYKDMATIIPVECPGLAKLVEEGRADLPETKAYLEKLLAPYAGKADSVVLGCTHYPFVKKYISEILGADTVVFDGGEGTARETRRRLIEAGIKYTGDRCGQVRISGSGDTEKIEEFCKKILNTR